jgi:hypothetical protein
VLIARGVTAWRRLVVGLTSATTASTVSADTTRTFPVPASTPRLPHEPVSPPVPPASQLIHILADLAVTLAGA